MRLAGCPPVCRYFVQSYRLGAGSGNAHVRRDPTVGFLEVANAILSRPNRRFGIVNAVRLAHAKGWEDGSGRRGRATTPSRRIPGKDARTRIVEAGGDDGLAGAALIARTSALR